MKLTNKRYLITGASSGLGLELVRHLLRIEGTKITAVARNIKSLEKLMSDRLFPLSLDIAKPENIDAMLDFAFERMGGVDCVIACAGFGYYERFEVDVSMLIDQVLRNHVTVNFHPDRFSNNRKTIIENLIEQGQYYGQFLTRTTNGGRTAYIGGDRFQWEQRLFFDAYPPDALDRPKYGALNIFRYLDGASVRFGSCFFTLKHEAINRCTFAYGDSSANPTTLCTSDTFWGILAGLFDEYLTKEKH